MSVSVSVNVNVNVNVGVSVSCKRKWEESVSNKYCVRRERAEPQLVALDVPN